jgi:hypothetical protein
MCFLGNRSGKRLRILRQSLTSYHGLADCQYSNLEGQMQVLRLPVVIVSSVALVVAQIPPGFAQNAAPPRVQSAALAPAPDATPSPAIVAAFKAYPKGGEELSKRIEDIIVSDPNAAPGLAKYVQTTPSLTKEQKSAAYNGLAAALNRMGINAADMPTKAPVYKAPPAAVPPPVTECWGCLLFALAVIGGVICAIECPGKKEEFISVSP